MIVAFSTSSSWSSVAAIDPSSGVKWRGSEFVPQGASGACLALLGRMMRELEFRLENADLFAADIGPGSFTGVRVAVTLAKTFGFQFGKQVAGATSFDLISTEWTVVLPSKKGEFFIREPGAIAFRSTKLPEEGFVGFGPGVETQTFPDAANFGRLQDRLIPCDATTFVPEYLIEPSISVPKKPYATQAGSSQAGSNG